VESFEVVTLFKIILCSNLGKGKSRPMYCKWKEQPYLLSGHFLHQLFSYSESTIRCIDLIISLTITV
jgi:hypothetical protein